MRQALGAASQFRAELPLRRVGAVATRDVDLAARVLELEEPAGVRRVSELFSHGGEPVAAGGRALQLRLPPRTIFQWRGELHAVAGQFETARRACTHTSFCIFQDPIMSHKCMSKTAVKTSKDTHKSWQRGWGTAQPRHPWRWRAWRALRWRGGAAHSGRPPTAMKTTGVL